MTHDEMIALIQAHKDGKTIQNRMKARNDVWKDAPAPSWNFWNFEYRVKAEPQTIYAIRSNLGVVVHCSANEDYIREKKRKYYPSDSYSVVEFVETMPS